MIFGGMWFNYPGCSYWVGWFLKSCQIIRLVFNVGILTLSGYGVAVTTSIKEKLGNNGFFFTVTFMITLQELMAVYNLDKFKRILNSFSDMWSKRDRFADREIFLVETKLAWKITSIFKLATYWNILVYLISPLLIDLAQAILTSGSRPYFVPMPLSEFLDTEHLERNAHYYLVTITSSIWLQSNAISCIAIQSIFCLLVMYTVAEIKILRNHISQLIILNDGTFDESSTFTFGLIIDEHQSIIRLYRQIKDYIGPQLAVQNVISSVSMCISFYVLSTEVDYDLIVVCGSALMCISFLGLMFFVCQLGENLTSQGISIHDEMYNMAWYVLKPKCRGNVYLVIMQAQQPMTINFRGTLTINVTTFSQIVNATYSYFTLLKTLY